MSTIPSSGVSQTSPTDTSATSSNGGVNSLASEDTFLKLFVAQLKNQDPLNPNQQDPTQMVSELAQFSQLEQLVNIGKSVTSIDSALTANTTSASGSTAAAGGNSAGSGNSGTTSGTQPS